MSTKASESKSVRDQRSAFIVILVLVVGAWLYLYWPASRYPELSHHGYEITVALYAACNAKSESKLVRLEEMVSASERENQIEAREAACFQAVFDCAKKGDWQTAARMSREMLLAQAPAAASSP